MATSGAAGFKARKSTPFAAQCAEQAAPRGTGVRREDLEVRQGRPRRESPVAPESAGLKIADRDVTPVPHTVAGRRKAAHREEYAWPGSGCQVRQCRREGRALPQGRKCFTDKCAIERRSYALGSTAEERRPHVRFRQAAAREAEAAPHIRAARAQFRKT